MEYVATIRNWSEFVRNLYLFSVLIVFKDYELIMVLSAQKCKSWNNKQRIWFIHMYVNILSM